MCEWRSHKTQQNESSLHEFILGGGGHIEIIKSEVQDKL